MSRTDKDQLNWLLTHYFRTLVPVEPEVLRDWDPTRSLLLDRPDVSAVIRGFYERHRPRRPIVREEGWCPDRRRERDACRAAVQEYNATGETETEPPVFQHRQGVLRPT
ncbi:hypothetical protein [Nonomuraea sp. NPDC049400]|uniref:hypothetical protein n=1 Tax=Nonomuraea sp. NPDC049400 TaxID=3364352 RepID=UPI0037B7D937